MNTNMLFDLQLKRGQDSDISNLLEYIRELEVENGEMENRIADLENQSDLENITLGAINIACDIREQVKAIQNALSYIRTESEDDERLEDIECALDDILERCVELDEL